LSTSSFRMRSSGPWAAVICDSARRVAPLSSQGCGVPPIDNRSVLPSTAGARTRLSTSTIREPAVERFGCKDKQQHPLSGWFRVDNRDAAALLSRCDLSSVTDVAGRLLTSYGNNPSGEALAVQVKAMAVAFSTRLYGHRGVAIRVDGALSSADPGRSASVCTEPKGVGCK
jgi:hypothetical protein